MDFLSIAYEPFDERTKPPSDLENELKLIVNKLVSPKFTAIMEKLAPIYSRQHRQKVFAEIFQQFESLDGATECLATFKSSMTSSLDEEFATSKLGFTRQHLLVWSPVHFHRAVSRKLGYEVESI
jgi:hypothetical protein